MQTWKLDEWDAAGDVTFIFGADARKPMIARAEALAPEAWRRLKRPAKYEVKTEPRGRPDNVKEQVVREKGSRTSCCNGKTWPSSSTAPTCAARAIA